MNIKPLEIYRGAVPCSLGELLDDLESVQEVMPFDSGPFGCSIPLPHSDLLHSDFRNHYNNQPFADVLDPSANEVNFPAFQSIFDMFEAEKTAFRLVKRPPQSAYKLHQDSDRGEGVWRFQVPIISGQKARLCLSDQTSIPEDRSDPDVFTPELFAKRFPTHRIESLEVGNLHIFNVDYIHTVINDDAYHRITLLLDIMMNEKTEKWCNQHMMPI